MKTWWGERERERGIGEAGLEIMVAVVVMWGRSDNNNEVVCRICDNTKKVKKKTHTHTLDNNNVV